MIRTQIQLTEEQARRLRALAVERGVSLAELIRQGVDAITASAQGADAETRRQRALAVAGRFRSGHADVSAEHDRHLAEAWQP
ncbi:MAG: ribbon-helix-helix protein, CopG family [Chloroflexi bacterium]|nr:ribbon-helix-helix protein, CopG family [Chloroflexota bacterium]